MNIEEQTSTTVNGTSRVVRGRARVYARAHINTDEIIPARYLNVTEETELARHAMEDIDPSFAQSVGESDVIVAGDDFGCGSSREHAVWALRGAGVRAVVANSFARIFFRNSVNNGFLAVECPGAADAIEEGDAIEIDPDGGVLRVPGRDVELTMAHPGEFAARIMRAGGLLAYVAESLRGGDGTGGGRGKGPGTREGSSWATE